MLTAKLKLTKTAMSPATVRGPKTFGTAASAVIRNRYVSKSAIYAAMKQFLIFQ